MKQQTDGDIQNLRRLVKEVNSDLKGFKWAGVRIDKARLRNVRLRAIGGYSLATFQLRNAETRYWFTPDLGDW